MLALDIAHFDAMTSGDSALQMEVIGLFRGQVGGWSGALMDGVEWRAAVHTMKGSARGIGLHALAHACEVAEQAPTAAAARALIEPALKEALAALDQFTAAMD